MAQKVQVTLVDDLDGSAAEETVSFSLDGVAYEIDLSEQNASRLRDTLAPFVGSARRGGGRGAGGGAGGRGRGRGARPARSGGGSNGGSNAEIREWAKQNGHKVSERGRIPGPVVEAYEKAHAS